MFTMQYYIQNIIVNWIFSSGYYDYDDYYNNMQGYEAYMQK